MSTLVWILALGAGLALGAHLVFSHPRFGVRPGGARLERVQASAHYRHGQFQNQLPTPQFSPTVNPLPVLWDFYFGRHERLRPAGPLPVIKTDLRALPPHDLILWLGHSSWYVQLGGRRLLIDPVLSDHAAPFAFLEKAFAGTGICRPEDLPELDMLLISHDHWDHLDYATVMALKDKIRLVACPLGLGASFESWGFDPALVRELDWGDRARLDALTLYLLPARHYSRRFLFERQSFWGSFALTAGDRRLFYSGDSGYGPHFAEIGRQFGAFDAAILECGQYDKNWPYIHMMPEESVLAALDLKARVLIPSHMGRFCIANHAWDEPLIRLSAASKNAPYQLATPRIGEPVVLNRPLPTTQWWTGIR